MSEVAQLEHQQKQAKELIERRDLALKLSKNRDFQKLILDDWMVTEAARLVALSADPAMTKEMREDSLAMAQAPGHLKRYLSVMVRMGNVAEGESLELDEQLAEARAEADAEQDDLDIGGGPE